jgi:hypothetical protein
MRRVDPIHPGQRVVRFNEFLKRLTDHDVEFFVIGGVAASLFGSPLPTLDLDVCAPMHGANLQKILDALRDIRPRFRMRPDKMPMPDDLERIRGIKNIYLVTDIGPIALLNEVPESEVTPSWPTERWCWTWEGSTAV